MKNFRYFIPTKILFGSGALGQLHEQELPGKKALIVITNGKSVKVNGYLDRLIKELELANVEYVIYDGVLPNPVLRNVTEGSKIAKDNQCDFVIGLGGGSPIDCAKAIAVMATNPGEDYWDYNSGITGKRKKIEVAPLPIVAITTTAGTGTEADPWSVITKEETNEKCGSGADCMYPTLSVVDPDLMMTVPPHLTAYQGFDALFHATESVINKNENVMGEMFALKAIEYLAKYLPLAVADGSNKEARAYVALANTYAGFFMLCTSEHSMEHALSAYHHELPHGAGLIMISKEYYQHFVDVKACDDLFVKMAKAMGKEKADKAQDFVDALVELQKACGVDNLKMSDYGITEDEIKEFAVNARGAMGGLFQGDPIPLSNEDVELIYRKSFK